MLKLVYKLFRPEEWQQLQNDMAFSGSPDDRRDGFIHFSTAEQLAETARRHFARDDLIILAEVEADSLGSALRWEPSRGGALFPHLYDRLPAAAVRRHWRLTRTDAGHALPEDITHG